MLDRYLYILVCLSVLFGVCSQSLALIPKAIARGLSPFFHCWKDRMWQMIAWLDQKRWGTLVFKLFNCKNVRKFSCNRKKDFLCLVERRSCITKQQNENPAVKLLKITTFVIWWLQFKVTFTRLIFPKPVSSKRWGRKYLSGVPCRYVFLTIFQLRRRLSVLTNL